MGKKKNIKRGLYTFMLLLLLSLCSFLTEIIVNRTMISRIEEKMFIGSYINQEQVEYSEWQRQKSVISLLFVQHFYSFVSCVSYIVLEFTKISHQKSSKNNQ